jgi:hypothetical protein
MRSKSVPIGSSASISYTADKRPYPKEEYPLTDTPDEISDPLLPKFIKKIRIFTVDKIVQTEHPDVLRYGTLINTAALLNGIENTRAVAKRQDQMLADEFEKLSSIETPPGTTIADFVCAPPDVMAYHATDEKGRPQIAYNCPEINGTGFGGMGTIPKKQSQTIMDTYAKAADEIKKDSQKNGEQPLIIVANSGREGSTRAGGTYDTKSNSKLLWEKISIADRCAENLGSLGDDKPICAKSFDKISGPYFKKMDIYNAELKAGRMNKAMYDSALDRAYAESTELMKKSSHKPMVLLGYTRDVVDCCKIANGRPYLFGRPVNGLVNDRAVLNLCKKEGQPLDNKQVSLINVSIEEGVNKVAATLARHEFHASDEAKALPGLALCRGFNYDVRGMDKTYHFKKNVEDPTTVVMTTSQLASHRLSYFRGVDEKEGLDGVRQAVDDFMALGLKPLFKPNGTGQSKGIIGYKNDESKEKFIERFVKNMEDIESKFGKGAGYPFLVMPLLKLDETAGGALYDLRWTIYRKIDDKGKDTIHSIPLIKKEEAPRTEEERKAGEYAPTNVTAAVVKTGKHYTDFITALCTENGLKEAKLTVDQAKSISLYFSSFQAWLLKTKYPRR